MLLHIPDLLSAEQLRQCRAALQAANWQDGRHSAGHQAVGVKANQQLAQDDPLAQQLAEFVLAQLGQSPRFMAAALPLKVLPPRFNRYAEGGSYGAHIDSAVFSVPGTPHRIRADLSATLFLSEPDEYDGGELVLQDKRVKLPAGHLLLYSSGSLHRVEPVTRGARLAAFFWVQSLVREESQRNLLLELDDSIQALRQQLPASPELLRLTGVYHNLLRQWSQT
ncbi:Fe(II)-dependent oxygenase [Pseudomonas sp. EGD-AK9]|uniref:Fe2+-dependent dioxygenase n=1 Tax=Pseudomonas sp. EGD-AK9 TaxID=1386078 RepID=UPI000396CE07|nr:Fe2+-dependent dioxygenase [Pseudomonas sp. EGD-AK9]ERI53293.1 Fe(II)-dependent oxygenase [Pseudomonas sp. EGD-AK9]